MAKRTRTNPPAEHSDCRSGEQGPRTWEIIPPDKFDFSRLATLPTIQHKRGNNAGNHTKYLDVISAFDIECTNLKDCEQAIMYVWQFAFSWGQCVVGRTWDELEDFIFRLVNNAPAVIPVWVHNLSYEFQFLRTIYNFNQSEVFAVKSRKVLKASMYGAIEFRCSYLHSNMSLKEYTHKMGVEHEKLSGEEYNYDVERFPWSPMTDRELEYAVNDVIGLIEALEVEMEADGDNVKTIPLTSTGYVRRDTKKAMRKGAILDVKNALPDADLYRLLREAFRGGNTHANRYYAGRVLHGVKSFDRSSSYPDVICNCKFPVKPFIREGAIELSEIKRRYDKEAFIMRVMFYDLRLKDPFFGSPYISRDKAKNIEGGIYDNGRVLQADVLMMCITDIDLKIIDGEYSYSAIVLDCWRSKYGMLPKDLRQVNIDYYTRKTELKGVEGQEIYYLKSKNKLNSVYGMMAQDPAKQNINFINGEFIQGNEEISDLLARYQKKAFLLYQWGVWVTAWARYRLEEGIKMAGDGFVYCDTDSVKYLGDVDWTAYNEKRKADSLKHGAFATDPKGITHYMGVYEGEGEYTEFKTLGAKKYAYREDGKLTITVAGVGKVKGVAELEAAGGIQAFNPGFVFRIAGGLDAKYNDNPPMAYYERDGQRARVGPNVYLSPSEYTLGITNEYEKLLEKCKLSVDKL